MSPFAIITLVAVILAGLAVAWAFALGFIEWLFADEIAALSRQYDDAWALANDRWESPAQNLTNPNRRAEAGENIIVHANADSPEAQQDHG